MKKLTIIAASLGLALPAAAGAQPQDDNGRMFAAIDTNGDGKLDKAEVTKMAELRAKEKGDPSLAAPEKIDSFIKHIDANGDGAIDKGEIQAIRDSRASPPPSEGE
ncbi:EF-hand domain-containing protein [Sphingopyxis macrogoltabida]|uniref:EF-hand domain-containing protein n=1 Tax=Sphingopyxis macrogoltabida TaxID=33050 RepID=A0AAC9FFA6_SPHMC|nr:EF-hand domain-containing protein [Sphingopyxis macrogoltabida]ALJ13772.1 hypothetical protein LH19_12920 [Sphingopyxis macrogoltabida]AMU88788.1 hypothetical protein ATM17_06990 [Sphingopyxis macrogoltabida]